MAISFVAGATALHAASSGTTLTVNVPAGVQDGDFLYAWVQVGGTGNNPTATGAWTPLDNQTAGTPSAGSFYRVASSEPASYDFTVNNASVAVAGIVAYRGVNTSTPINQHSIVQQSGSGTNVNSVSGGITPNVNGTMIVFVASVSTNSTWTAPGGYTPRTAHQGTHSLGFFELQQGAAGSTGTITAVASTGGGHDAQVIALVAAAVSTTKTQSADAVVLKTATKTQSADAVVLKTATKAQSVDAIIKKTATVTQSADGVVLGQSMQYGDSSSDVGDLNDSLEALGLPRSIDNYFGWKTVRAICTVQQAYGRVPTGIADATTLDDIANGYLTFDGALLYEDSPQTGTGPAAYAED